MKVKLHRAAVPSTNGGHLRTIACLATWVAGSFFAEADEATMAWHFAASPESTFRYAIERVELISEPPAATIFAGKGDRLIDLSRNLKRATKTGNASWLIWNETRRLLIAHAEAPVLFQVEQISRFSFQPQMAALTLDWYQGLNPDVTAKPLRRLEIQGRSGKPLSSGWEDNPEAPVPMAIPSVHLVGELKIGDTIDTDFNFTLKWTEQVGDRNWRWSMESAVRMEDVISKPVVLLKASSPSGNDWSVVARTQRRLVDGTPLIESRWTEEKGKAVAILPWTPDQPIEARAPAEIGEGKLWLRVCRVAPYFFSLISSDSSPAAAVKDPFTTSGESSPVENPFGGMKVLSLPASLRSGMPGVLLDVKKLLHGQGILFSQGEFIGYDPFRYTLYAATASATESDKVRALISVSSPCCDPKNLAISLFGGRQGEKAAPQCQLSFTARSEHRGTLTCQEGEAAPVLRWVILPILGESEGIMDLHQEFRLPASIAGAVAETIGDSSLAIAIRTPFQTGENAGTKTTLSLQADIQEIHEPETP